MAGTNRRLFRAAYASIAARSRRTEPAHTLRLISPVLLRSILMQTDYTALIKLARKPTPKECAAADEQFAALNPRTQHRGKFVLSFFFFWLDVLGEEGSREGQDLFASANGIKGALNQLSPRSLATRSPIPPGLPAFVLAVETA